MKKDNYLNEPELPWVEGREDRLFKRLVIIFVLLFLALGVIINQLSVPEIEQKKLVDVAPRLAKLILEKKKTPPPPPLKKVIKKPEPKKPKDKPKPKPKPKAKKPPVKKPPAPAPDKRAAAKKQAQQAGLIALSDELADLRDSFDFSDIAEQPQIKTGKQAETTVSTSKLLTAKATQGSGGIKTPTLPGKIKNSELAQRKTTSVSSRIESKQNIQARASSKTGRNAKRSQEEIERVFQKNKGAIFSIYNRELRKDPSLQGKVVIELTIAPNGSVTRAVIVSSELNHKKLERRLLSKIKKFRFASKQVPAITVTYPIDFLPS